MPKKTTTKTKRAARASSAPKSVAPRDNHAFDPNEPGPSATITGTNHEPGPSE